MSVTLLSVSVSDAAAEFAASCLLGSAFSTSPMGTSVASRPQVSVRPVVRVPLWAMSLVDLVVVARANDVDVVRGTGIPPKVRESIVRLIAIKVAALQTFRCSSNERLQHQAVDEETMSVSGPTEVDHEIAGPARRGLQHPSPDGMKRVPIAHSDGSNFGPDSTLVRHGVEILVSGYGTPRFVRHLPILCEA